MLERTWRERHPFLYGMSQTFGIFPVRRRIETVEESFARVADAITDAAAQARSIIGAHGPECEGPDEDGDWYCGISSKEPGLCPTCLHEYGIERQMTLADTAPERIWYLCYTCAHGC